jgi:hypothetical protein
MRFRALAVGFTMVGMVLGVSMPAHATDLTLFKTVFNTDFVSAGADGMRGNGTGTINLAGVSGTVTEAYLFWHGPNNNADNLNNANVNFNGTDVTGTFLGVSNDNCWGFANSLAYRANVTSLITGNGAYTLSNFLKGGSDVNGASLIVFFNDGNDSNNRDVVMFNGNDSNQPFAGEDLVWNIILNGINFPDDPAATGNAQFHVADGQPFGPGNDGTLLANGTDIGNGNNFDGTTIPGGVNADPFLQLWDIVDFDVTSLLDPGLNALDISLSGGTDCLACVMIAIDLPAGAAPDQPDDTPRGVPAPASLVFLGLGLAGTAFLRRLRA